MVLRDASASKNTRFPSFYKSIFFFHHSSHLPTWQHSCPSVCLSWTSLPHLQKSGFGTTEAHTIICMVKNKRGGDSLCVIMLVKPYIFSVCHVNRITCNSLLSTFLISADSPESCTTDSFSLCWFEVNSHRGSSWLGITLSSWPQVSQLKALVTETFLQQRCIGGVLRTILIGF